MIQRPTRAKVTRPTRGICYVYVYFYPDGRPCYVGVGRNGRWREHLQESGGRSNPFLRAIIRAAGGNLPVVFVREQLTQKEAHAVEIALIKAIGRHDLGTGPLVNLTNGGNGGGPLNLSSESRERIRIAARKPKSPEHIAKVAAANRGKKRTAEYRARASAIRLGTKHSAEHTAKTAAANRGKKRTAETGARISAALIGRKRSAEARAAMKAGWAKRKAEGKPTSHPQSEATKAKISATRRARIALGLISFLSQRPGTHLD